MYLVFFLLYTNPTFLFLGWCGLFGETGRKAANDMMMVYLILVVIVLIIAVGYVGLRSVIPGI
jgi:hypothetical protein